MYRRLLMAAISSTKPRGSSIVSEKPNPATSTMGKKKAQIRNFSSKSSPVYKTQSDTSLVDGMKNLSLRDKTNSPSRPHPPRRAFGSGTGIVKCLGDVAGALHNQQVKNVVIVAGAGISTPSGIPDFRSPGTGLYDNLQQYKIPYPEAIFDIDYFHHNPRPFFTLAKELYPSGKYRPNYIHYFARLLHDKGMLLRMYTQNIDGLERLAGIPPTKMVEAHGTFATATCVICSQKYNGEDIKEKIFDDKIPRCKRSGCPGMIKPDIVFFGEELPKRFYYYLKDMLQTDLVLVMGTSLEVQPFAGIIDNVRWGVPRVLFNMKAVGPFRHNKRSKDLVAEGDLLDTMQKFVGMIDWKTDMADLITKSEGEFKIANPPPPVEKTTPASMNKLIQSEAVMWRQRARLDLFKGNFYFSSSESSSSETESESSEEEKPRSRVGFGRGKGVNSRFQISKNDTSTRKYGTSSQRNLTNPVNKKPPVGAWIKPPMKQKENGAVKNPKENGAVTKPKENGTSKQTASPLRVNRSHRPQSDSSRPLTRCSSGRGVSPSQNENGSKRVNPGPKAVNGQGMNRQTRVVGGVSPKVPSIRPPIQPSSKPRAAQQQRLVERQKTLFRVGSAEVPRLTYRHRLPNSTYSNQSSSESSSDSSSDDSR